MATQRRLRGAATATQEARTHAGREADIDTTKWQLKIHDGVTPGGIAHARFIDVQGNLFRYAAGSGTNAITATLAPAPSALAAGFSALVKIANTNTGAVTLNLNSLGAVNVKKWVSGAKAALEADDLPAGAIVEFVHDGTDFVVQFAGSGDSRLILSETISGSPATVEFEDLFIAGHSYRLDLIGVEADGNADLLLQLGTSGASWVTTGYNYTSITHNGAGTVAAESSTGGSSFNLCPAQISPNEDVNGSIWVYDPRGGTSYCGVRSEIGYRANGTSQIQRSAMAGEQRNALTALSSLRLDLESTNTFGGGLVAVYEFPNA